MLKQESNNEKQRLFICPCSKSYFSYAALFTHIKQKHDGKPPGAITKPHPLNKRGRPPKQKDTSKLEAPSFKTRISSNSSISPEPASQVFDLKCTPGSQFKQYGKLQQSVLPTSSSLPSQSNLETELIRDISRYLEIKPLKEVPPELIEQVQSKIHEQSNLEAKLPLESFQCFFTLCKEGLQSATYSQILFLLNLLFLHIQSSLNSSEGDFSADPIHTHLISFFDFINKTSRTIDLSPFDIFSDLNTIKTLIVFLNWLSKFESKTAQNKASEK